jgi:hypothetical protein
MLPSYPDLENILSCGSCSRKGKGNRHQQGVSVLPGKPGNWVTFAVTGLAARSYVLPSRRGVLPMPHPGDRKTRVYARLQASSLSCWAGTCGQKVGGLPGSAWDGAGSPCRSRSRGTGATVSDCVYRAHIARAGGFVGDDDRCQIIPWSGSPGAADQDRMRKRPDLTFMRGPPQPGQVGQVWGR